MIEKINPAIPIPIESSSIPDEQREITIAKSNIAIPNPIFFIVNPPLQVQICSLKFITPPHPHQLQSKCIPQTVTKEKRKRRIHQHFRTSKGNSERGT